MTSARKNRSLSGPEERLPHATSRANLFHRHREAPPTVVVVIAISLVLGLPLASPLTPTQDHGIGPPPFRTAANPPGGLAASMAFDPIDNYTVMFGWEYPGLQNETWVFSNLTWTRLGGLQPPAAATGPTAMTWDNAAGRILLYFQGWGGVSQTWEFLAGSWTNVSLTAGSPPLDGYLTLQYDPQVDASVLVGIHYAQYGFLQTWEFVRGAWRNVTGGPTPRWDAENTLVWDPAIASMILFEIRNCSDTWRFQNTSWTHFSTSDGVCQWGGWPGVSYDAHDNYVLAFSGGPGGNCAGIPCGSTWIFSQDSWRSIQPNPSPPVILEGPPAMSFDARIGQAVLFGGAEFCGCPAGVLFSDATWVYANGVWRNVTAVAGLTPAGPPDTILIAMGAAGAVAGIVAAVALLSRRNRLRGSPPIPEVSAGEYQRPVESR